MKKASAFAAAVAAILLACGGIWYASRPAPDVFQGQMEARETDIAPKVPGRIAQVLVKEGDKVAIGTQLITIDSPEVAAKLEQATAARDAARAVSAKAEAGARAEEIRMAQANWQRAQAAADLAQNSLKRVEALAREGLIAEQKRDEALTNYRAARDLAAAARAQYDMAKAGARAEDKAAAAAQARQVSGVVAEVEAAKAETELKSPVAGEVAKVFARPGELSPQGVAVVTVVDLQDQWAVFNVREDKLQRFAEGKEIDVVIPALGNRKARMKVYYVAALPDFATWRATHANQGFDARTFEVRARPAAPIDGVRPGMSVIVQ